jgi:ABC-type uncharacterized transport system permease subunit
MIGAALLIRTVELSIATLYAAMGGVVSERSGIVAVGLEGMMLMGAFFGHLVAWWTGSLWLGMAGGIGAGAGMGLIHAYATVTRRGDQIVSGVALNIVALGVTTYLLRQVYGAGGSSAALIHRAPGAAYVIGAVLLCGGLHLALSRSVWGLRTRAAGERPRSLWEAGVGVGGLRFANVVISGALAGLGGTYLSICSLGQFTEGMTAGRGFLALAALIFGRWTPLGAAAACLAFGFFDAVAISVESGTAACWIPSDFLHMAPYAAAIVVLAALARRGRPPAALGKPFDPERA